MPDVFGNFDFSLNPEQQRRAQRLHRDAIIVDTMHQGPCGKRAFTVEMINVLKAQYAEHRDSSRALRETWTMPIRLALKGKFPALEQTWRDSGLTVRNQEISAADSRSALASFSFLQKQFDSFPWLHKILVADDFAKAKKEGLLGSFISTQGSNALGRDLTCLDVYHDMGMRMLQLTYNSVNYIGGGCTDRTDCGVTSFGKSFIERMNDIGMIVDISHCGRSTSVDACKISSKPVAASHTGCYSIYEAPRNKTDDEIKYIADKGGYIGIYCLPNFLTYADRPTVEHVLDHVDYVSQLVGWQHVGIGSDFPFAAPDEWGNARLAEHLLASGFSPKDGFANPKSVKGFDDYRDFPNITRGLVSRGYSDEQIWGILGGNFMRVFREVCG
ncbi:membrane dipeptidase [Bradyrhizobium sp. 200]|uniref:dipeptidase n=1 Tax=Bradyrhizobium sp. 200 TaxID=2782665 RepID=UPI0020005741|nr:membrane dipeptidase [Bradyrhizobium sp. 200]UPJ47828.1 membrane dipeptidase [Bradyrhizobium sp. 200]